MNADRRLPRNARLLCSGNAWMPFVAGLFRPAIVFPADADTRFTRAQYDEVILHEAAHLQRFDDWTALLYQCCRAALWVNPFVWIIGRQMTRDREFACDDLVVEQTGDPKSYAATIWTFAQRYTPLAAPALGLHAGSSQLLARLTRLMKPGKTDNARVAKITIAVSAALAGLMLTMAGLSALPADRIPDFKSGLSDSFLAVSPMHEPRSGHTATLLRNGNVLITGGTPDTSVRNGLADAEIYDSGTRRFHDTGNMSVARTAATATRLENGDVLIAGGATPFGVTAAAELYHVDTGAFETIGKMNVPRARHSATLLEDGRVLIAGGITARGPTRTAELFDPSTRTFRIAGAMRNPRAMHASALLGDGRVLIVGGDDESTGAAGHGEIFDPVTGRFSSRELRMTAQRVGPALLPLGDGKMLVVGGGYDDAVRRTKPSAEVFNPSTGAFTISGYLHSARFAIAAGALTLRSGAVLVAGGGASAETFSESTGKFKSAAGSLGMDREEDTATLLDDGTVLITGGYALKRRSTITTNGALLFRE